MSDETDDIPVLLSPDGSEMVAPMHDASFMTYHAFMGFETGKLYETAMIRIGQQFDDVAKRLQTISNLGNIAGLFCIDDSSHIEIVGYLTNGMLNLAHECVDDGVTDGQYIRAGEQQDD